LSVRRQPNSSPETWMTPFSTLKTPLGSVFGGYDLSVCGMKVYQPARSWPLKREIVLASSFATAAGKSAQADTTARPSAAAAKGCGDRIVVVLRAGTGPVNARRRTTSTPPVLVPLEARSRAPGIVPRASRRLKRLPRTARSA
jgi:hypothetical protein